LSKGNPKPSLITDKQMHTLDELLVFSKDTKKINPTAQELILINDILKIKKSKHYFQLKA
jgi:hypothetical protein